jgi:hypothetical protein
MKSGGTFNVRMSFNTRIRSWVNATNASKVIANCLSLPSHFNSSILSFCFAGAPNRLLSLVQTLFSDLSRAVCFRRQSLPSSTRETSVLVEVITKPF